MMFNSNSRTAKTFLRAISIVLTNTFLFSGITFAAPNSAERSMLAPASIAWAMGLSEKEVEEVCGKTALGGRVSEDTTKWMALSFSRWMEHALRYAGESLQGTAPQEGMLKDAYVMALDYRLAALVKRKIITPRRAEEVKQSLIGSPAFASEFSKAFAAMQAKGARAPKINPDIYKGMDIRGIADSDLTDDASFTIGRAFAAFIKETEKEKAGSIVVGMDPRGSSGRIKDNFIKGILESGIDVIDLTCGGKHYIPTPVIYWAMREYKSRGGCNVTASHLPTEYNGLKLAKATGLDTLSSEDIQRVREIAENDKFEASKTPGKIIEINPLDEYKKWMIEHMRSAAGTQTPLAGLKFSIDYGNGTTSFIGDVFRELGANIIDVNREQLPVPKHVADPSKKENLTDLIESVKTNKSDLGIAYDSDGDRVGFVDDKGNVVTGNDLLAILAIGMLEAHPGSAIVVNSKASYAVPSFIKEKGGVSIFGSTGYAHIRERMKKINQEAGAGEPVKCYFGGEESGHVLFTDNDYFDDGMYTTVKLLAMLAKQKAKASDLVSSVSHYYTKEEVRLALPIKDKNIAAANERKRAIVAKLIPDLKNSIGSTMGLAIGAASFEDINIDGPKIYLKDGPGNILGWILIRVSENEPVITCNIEAIQPAGQYSSIYDYLLNQVVPLMAKYGELDIKKLRQYQTDVRKEFIAPLIAKGDRSALEKAIAEEAKVTGRPEYAVSVGIVGREKEPGNDDEWLMAHPATGPPAVNVLHIGGGGEGATTFVQTIVDSVRRAMPYGEYKMLEARLEGRLVGSINDGVYDDGGDTAKIRTELHDSNMWPHDVTTLCGDIMSVIAYSTGDDAKIFFMGDDFRMSAVININTADEDTLRYICDETTAKNILAERAARGGSFSSIDDLKAVMAKTDGKLFGRVKANLKLEGNSKTSVVDFVKDRIKKTQDKIDTGVFKRPADWLFFVNNMLGLARIADENLVKTHDITLIGAKWQNLMDLAVKIEAGYIRRGSNDFNISKDSAVNKLYEILGIAAGYAKVVSKDDATMVAILEAAALKVPTADGKGEEGFLIAPQGGNFRIQKVDVEISGDIMATPVTAAAHTVKPGGYILERGNGRSVKFTNINGELFISIDDGKEMKVYEPREPGRTEVSINGVDTLLSLDAGWVDIDLDGIKVSMKSRMVEEQTFITDEVLASRLQKLTFKIAKRDKGGKYDYEKNPDGSDKRDKSGMRKVRKFEKITPATMPKADGAVLEMIQKTKKAFVYGEGGMITSLLPDLLVKDLVSAVHARIKAGVRGIYYPKLTEDFETKGLSLREQIEVLDKSIKELTGTENGFSGMITDIILPQIPDDIKERADILYKEAQEDFEKHKDEIAKRTEKISKYYPMGLQKITEDDLVYLKGKGIRIHYTANFDINSKKKLVWNKKELYKLVEMISSRAPMVAMIKDAGDRKKAEDAFDMGGSLESSFKGELLWPKSDWDQIFEAVSRVLPETDLVTIVFNRGKKYERIFRLRIPKGLEGRNKEMLVQHMAAYLYNRIAVFGARSVEIYSPHRWVYDDLMKKFEEERYSKIKDFLTLYNGMPLRIEYVPGAGYYGTSPFTLDGDIINRREASSGVNIGLDLKDDSVGVVVIQDGNIRKTKYLGWNPAEINNPDDLIKKIAGYVRDTVREVRGLSGYDSIGISWPAAISNNRIIGRAGKIVSGFDNEKNRMVEAEFGEKIGRLADHLSKELGKPVVVVNNGQAVAYKKVVESPEKPWNRTLFLGLGEGVSVSYVDNDRVVDILGELGNMVIDMNVDAPRHNYTGVKGALQQYLSRSGALRLGKILLPGDMPLGEVRNSLGMIYEEASKKYEGRLKELNTNMSELLPKKPENMSGQERLLHDEIMKDISGQFAARVARLHTIYSNMWTVLLPSRLSSLQKNGDLGSSGEFGQEVIRKIADEARKLIHRDLDKRIDVILEDDLSFGDIYTQWLGGNPQANLIFDNMAKYLAEALTELRQYIKIENVVIHGDIAPAEIRTYIKNKTNDILKRDYGIGDLEVETLSENTPERKFVGAIGAAYAASMRKDLDSHLQDLEGQVIETARVLGLKQEMAIGAFLSSIDKTKLLNDIAESVGIKKAPALKNMEAAGLARNVFIDEKKGIYNYDLTESFFTAKNLNSLVVLQKDASDNKVLVDLAVLRMERIILNSVMTTELFKALAGAGNVAETIGALEMRGVLQTLTATWRLAEALKAPAKAAVPLKKEALVSPEAASFYSSQDIGIAVDFSVPVNAMVNPAVLEAIRNYQAIVAKDMARGEYNYRGAGTKQTVKQFYEDYFAREWRDKILAFVATRFSDKEPLKAIITNGIGANDQFMWSLVKMYNANKKDSEPVWYHVTTARGFADIVKKNGINGENTLFIDISRSGTTWEGIEVAVRSLALGFNKRIAVANGGTLVKIAQITAAKNIKEPLIIGMSPDIGGRNMHRKTSIYYTAQTVAGMFVKEMEPGNFAAKNDMFDRANDFAAPEKSLAVSAGRFLFGSMRLLGVNHIAFVTNTEALRLVGTEWEQYIMEGSNKEDVISMGIHDLTKEPEHVLANLAAGPAGKKTVGMAILDKADREKYTKDLARINKLKETMPLMVFTIDSSKANLKGGIGVKEQAAFDILWTDMVTVFTTLLRVDANSNPNVKVVRESTKERVRGWEDTKAEYDKDLVGQEKGKSEMILTSYGSPNDSQISTDNTDKQKPLTAQNAVEEGKRIAKELFDKGLLKGRDRLNIFAGTEELEELAKELRSDAYKGGLSKQLGWIIQTGLFPIWSHKGLEANLAYSANPEKPLLANKTVNIFFNARELGQDNKLYNEKFDGTGIMSDEKDAKINQATVHQTNNAMTMPNIKRMAEVSPTILVEFKENNKDIEEVIKKFCNSLVDELTKLLAKEERAADTTERVTKSFPAGEPEKLTAEDIFSASTAPDRDSLRNYLTSLSISGVFDDRTVIIAHDTALSNEPIGQVARAGEASINRYLDGKLIDVRGTGRKLLEGIQQAVSGVKGKYVVVTIAGDGTMQEAGDGLSRAGKVLNIQNPDGRYIPVIGLYEVALRIAYDSNADEILSCLNRIARNTDNSPFTKNDVENLLLNGLLRILPKIVPVDASESAKAYKAAQQALVSL